MRLNRKKSILRLNECSYEMAFIDQGEIKIACSSEMNVPKGRPNID